VLSCDEKSQIQTLNRTPPELPMKGGRAGTTSHDYIRHRTTTLFVALKASDGRVDLDVSTPTPPRRVAQVLQVG
jgi:hypothetical protein